QDFFECCRNEDVAILFEERSVRYWFAALITVEYVMLLGIRDGSGDVDALRIIVSAGDVRDTDDLASRVGEHPRGDRADISEALYNHARSRRRHTHALHLIERAERDPPSGPLAAAVRPADLDRFPGHNTGHGAA